MGKPKTPRVVSFAYRSYTLDNDGGRRMAECIACGRRVLEKAGTTSNFTRHLKKRHPLVFKCYQESKGIIGNDAPSLQNCHNSQDSKDGLVNTRRNSLDLTETTNSAELQLETKPLDLSNIKFNDSTPLPEYNTTQTSDDQLTVCIVSNSPQAKTPCDVKSIRLPKKCNARETKSALIDLLVNESLPLEVIESESFKDFAKTLNRSFKPISLANIKSEVAERCSNIQADLRQRLIKCPSVNVTVNVWTDRKIHSFIAVTVHAIEDFNNKLELLSYLLSCERLVGKEVFSTFGKIVEDFKLGQTLDYNILPDTSFKNALSVSFLPSIDKSDTFTLDGGEHLDDDSIWSSLDENPRRALAVEVHNHARQSTLQCFAHSLNLYINHVLASTECIRLSVLKVCRFSTMAHTDSSFAYSLQSSLTLNIDSLTPNTRKWKPTICNIEAMLGCDQEKLYALCQTKHEVDMALDVDDRSLLKELIQILQPFYESTLLVEKNSSISVVMPTVLALYKHLMNFMQKAKLLRPMVTEMVDLFYQRFKGIFVNVGMSGMDDDLHESTLNFGDQAYIQAAVLDPTFAFHWLSDVDGDKNVKLLLKKRIIDDIIMSAESQLCFEKDGSNTLGTDDIEPLPKKFKLFANYGKKDCDTSGKVTAAGQLEKYLKMVESGCKRTTCLQFWTKYKNAFNLILPLARKVLAVPAFGTTVEQVIAQSGVMVRSRRASTHDMLSHLIFLKSNSNYQYCNN